MNSKERMRIAMNKGIPDRVPVMCQLSLGHYFLNSKLPNSEIWFTSEGFAETLVDRQKRYRFDGTLINLPGRHPEWRSKEIKNIETHEEGEIIYWTNGDRTKFPLDDNPRHQPGPDCKELRADFDSFEPDDLNQIDKYTMYTWNTYHVPVIPDKPPGLLTEVPDWMLSTVKSVQKRVGNEVSVHAEVFSPFTHFMELFGYEEAMLAILDDADKAKEILLRLVTSPLTLARAYAKLNVDAILISSAFAGAGFLSKQQYRDFVLPAEKELVRAIKETSPEIPLYTHTCGAIGDRLDLMESSGIDGIDTLDPPPLGTVQLEDAKTDLGNRLFIKGNVDSVSTLLMGTPENCEKDLQQRLEIGKPGGGYILSTACSVAPRVSPEMIDLFYATADKFGHY